MVLRQLGKTSEERAKYIQESVEHAKEAVQMDYGDGTSWCEYLCRDHILGEGGAEYWKADLGPISYLLSKFLWLPAKLSYKMYAFWPVVCLAGIA